VQEYDLAFSFAGEHRDYVSRTAAACKQLGLKVFYDKDMNNEWWGKNFIREQRDVYSSKARFFVPFISSEYLAKPIPMDEFSAAMMTAVKQGDGYILPVLMDDTEVPPDLLHPHIHYLRSRDFTPEQLAAELKKRVGASGQPPTEIGRVVEHALELRMPKIVPASWSKYEELDKVFEKLTADFRRGGEQLRQRGLICSVRERPDHLIVRVERGGQTVAGLDVRRGTQIGDDHITWSTNYTTSSSNSYNGWATPTYDKGREQALIEISDMTGMMTGQGEGATYDEFVALLWERLIEQVERR
jgi:TIR domain